MATLLSYNERKTLRMSEEFKHTNKVWNQLRLNQTAKIGSLIQIASDSNARTQKEFEQYYFKTGEIRNEILKTKMNISEMEMYILNNLYGRTYLDLLNIARELKKYVDIPLNLLYNFVYIRVIDETWIGHMREQKALTGLLCVLQKYQGFYIKHADKIQDKSYAIDFEVFYWGNPICGIQVKSIKYKQTDKNFYAKKYNLSKNDNYSKLTGNPVFECFVNDEGIIEDLSGLISGIFSCVENPVKKKDKNICKKLIHS